MTASNSIADSARRLPDNEASSSAFKRRRVEDSPKRSLSSTNSTSDRDILSSPPRSRSLQPLVSPSSTPPSRRSSEQRAALSQLLSPWTVSDTYRNRDCGAQTKTSTVHPSSQSTSTHLRSLTLPPIPSMHLRQEPDLLNQLTPFGYVPPSYPPNPLASNPPALISSPMQLGPSYYQEGDHPSQSHLNHPQGDPKAHLRRKRHHNLPKDATTALKEWFLKNESNPYPTEEEKAYLVGLTGLSHSQVC